MSNGREKMQKIGSINTSISMFVVIAIIAIAMVFIAICVKITKVSEMSKIQGLLTAENLRAGNYTQITDENAKVENCDYVLFSAFFTRDLDGDGNAEKLLGTCKEINEPDQLYIDLNVLSNGYLENGKITINGTNFNYAMNMVKDDVLKNTYVSNNVKEIELKKIGAGTQKLIIGNAVANLGNNVNNYTAGISLDDLNSISKELQPQQVNTITLTGTHVADDGTKTEISKTIPVTIDWYGTAKTYLYTQNATYYYNDMDSNTISINVELREVYNKLILNENVANLSIPDLNGFAPVEVKCINSNVESQYNTETKVLSIKRKSKIDENGKVISSLPNSNWYTVEITYPQEAYNSLQSYTTITVPIVGYYTGYNNQNEEFENPYKTNIAKGQVTVLFRDKPQGDIYNFYVYYDNKKYVENPYYKYVISKQNLINLYNKQELDEQTPNEKFTVKWIATRGGIGEVPSMVMSETKQENEKYGDKFSNIVMDEYIVNTGIYFKNADNMLGKTGEIKLYDNDTNELIKTFTVEEWNTYTKENPYKYEMPIKHIRVETSKANVNSTLEVHNIKELQTVKFVQDYTKEQLKQMNTVYTYLTGVCNIEGQESGIRNVLDYAEFIEEKSMATISVSKNRLETQETTKNQNIKITARCNNFGDSKWKNANYIVEIPKEIINMEINDVYITNNNVQLVGYELYQENGQYFVRILTENEEPDSYEINIYCDMTPDPRKPTSHRNIKLYASNEWNDEYYYQTQDIYDVNGNNDTEEFVGENSVGVDLLSPTSLITLETVSNYNNKQEITVAPNIADVDKQTREATINLELTNNYATTVSGIQLLGKIPYQGNTYILNGNSMNSQFTTIMKNTGIQVPQELQEKTVVYYSTNENPDKDITNPANGWTLLKNVEDFSKIKSYLIDMKYYILEKGKQYNFNYVVSIPEGIEYNKVSYSNHAVFYELDTDGGMLALSTEPNKVGIRIARKFDLEVIKNKAGMVRVVPGATYKLTQINENGEEITSKISTTDTNGKIIFKDLYIDAKYIFKEVRESNNYSINNDIVEFEAIENANGELIINVISQDKFKTVPVVTKNANGREIVKTMVEDEPKYNVEIIKTDIATGEKIGNVQFKIAETGDVYKTNSDGKVIIEKLQQNTTYTLKEIKADGYYLIEDIQFKLIKDEQGNLKIESQNSNFTNAIIENTEESDLIKVSLGISNEKIPTYKLQILKVEENSNEVQKQLSGATFRLTGKDLNTVKYYTTDENGYINIQDLYQYIEGKYITGEYTLQEIKAPAGYSNNAELIKFKVIKNNEGNLEISIDDKDSLTTLKESKNIDENTIRITIKDKPIFKLTKTDKDTNEKMADIEFTIYEIDDNENMIDYAKDVNGKYIGEKNNYEEYVIKTDENGEIALPLKNGNYMAIEKKYKDGYKEDYSKYKFKIGEKIEIIENDDNVVIENVLEDTDLALEINYIEDLVDFSKDVNNGNDYSKKLVKLNRTLDFEDESCYKNADSKEYGDLNGNGVIETIKQELTNKENGCGFTPIGKQRGFGGTFDGQGNEIRNIYIKADNTGFNGLFGHVFGGKIVNLGITGNMILSNSGYNGSIVGYIGSGDTKISNCYSKVVIKGNKLTCAGGVIGRTECKIIENVYNYGDMYIIDADSLGIGGIIGENLDSKIINCVNMGNIEIEGEVDSPVGGITGKSLGTIISSNNYGNIKINRVNGGNTEVSFGGITGFGGLVKECKNEGKIYAYIGRDYNNPNIGGIEGRGSNKVINCYNTGEIVLEGATNVSIYGRIGGICGDNYSLVKNCYNEADIKAYFDNKPNYATDICAGGICGNSNSVASCYNKGNIVIENKSTKNLDGYVGGIGGYQKSVQNCYNEGNIVCKINDKIKEYYNICIGGISGYSSNISNSYTTGDVNLIDISNNNNNYGKIGAICGKSSNTNIVKDSFYLSTIEIRGKTINKIGEEVTSDELCSIELFNKLNITNQWIYKEGGYPQLLIGVPICTVDGTEIKVQNEKLKYKITTEVEKINGVKGGTITGEYEEPYETVNYGKDNTKEIKMIPDDNYAIVQITINGVAVDFIVNDDGSYTIPAGYFTEMKENKHVVVKYMKKNGTLTINKVDKDNKNIKLKNAKFRIESVDTSKTGLINEIITTNDLGQAFAELPFGKYKITEIEAPDGYKLNSEPIIFEMKENEQNTLTIKNSPNTDENYDIVITKVEKTTNKPIADTKFIVYELDENQEIISFAKGIDGDFVGDRDEQGNYIISTDETGKIRLKLQSGSYKAVEIESAPGYVLKNDENLRTMYFNVGDIKINYIEDLLDLSKNVTNGDNYNGKIITMTRSLDFNDDNSYRNPNDTTTYGDYNLDGQVEGIKAELTNKNGVGFHPIGKETNSKEEGKAFSGAFDGNGYEIKNLYINSEYSALFSNITSGNVCNLKLSNVRICDKGNGSFGLGYNIKDSNISNCSISGNVSSENSIAGGLAHSVENSTISNCYNTGEISAQYLAQGLAYKIKDSTVNNCYNTETITALKAPAGGLVYLIENSAINNCYNTGKVTGGPSAGGLAYEIKDSTISNCYNTGKITAPSGTVGGLANSISDTTITNSYNTGIITSLSVPAGGLVFSIRNTTIINCYNTGTVVGNYCIAGIATQVYENSSIENCYNTGEFKPCETSKLLNYGAILFSNNGGDTCTIKNTYYLNTTATQGIYGKDDEIGKTESKTLEEMQSKEFANILNNNKETMTDSDKLSNWVHVKSGVPTLHISNSSNLIAERTGKNITIINEKQSKIIVHHYLEGTGPEYNNEPVILAEDEVIMGAVDDKYITSPKMDIPDYELVKNENGEYIIPSNASGNFTENEQHVYYYYNVKPVELTVHHYLEGTEDKLAEDEQYFYQKGDHYKVTPSEEVLKTYDFVSVDGTEEKDIIQDEVVTYYYKLKQYKITTKVEIPEFELEAGRTEKGGTISGEDEQPYEIVKHGENSQKPLIATPDIGYKVSTITINGNQVQFTVKTDGTVELPQFENMTEDKEIIVSFVPVIGKVITHHYIQGTTEKLHEDIINEDKVGTTVKTEPINIDDYKLVGSEGNKDIDGNVIITKEISEGVEEIIYYYQVCYKITTDVIEHTENYKDGTVTENVKGGTITDEDVVIHEQVMKYEDNVKTIEIKPDSEYEIETVLVNGKTYDFISKLDVNGNVILPAGTFTNVQEDIHVEVKFRKKSKVIVKYLEEGTQTKLAPETIIPGFEGKEFNTIAEIIPGYNLVKIPISSEAETNFVPKVTDEDNNSIDPSGTMFSDDLTIVYWYKKIDANIIVRYIETNEKGEEIEIESELCKDSVGTNVTTNRKKYDKFISVDAPEETREKIVNNYPNITIMGKDDNSKTVTVLNGESLEVWYYYEKQYNITTEVKTHKETINGVEIQVAGGTISKAYKLDEHGEEVEVTYEVVNSRGNNTKAIEMIPEVGYRVKTITINDKEILINNVNKDDLAILGIIKDGEKVTLKEGYFQDVQNDFHVVVEFERIPAKVIVKYIDVYTKESILEDKIVEGYLYDEYNEQRVDIEGYIPTEPEPENSTGKMTTEPIIVIYYYTKQFKITTDVKEHLEDEVKSIVDVIVNEFDETIKRENSSVETGNSTDENDSTTEESRNTSIGTESSTEEQNKVPKGKVLVKGGIITGEDEQPYETVLRGKENKKQIEIIPNEGYRIKSLTIIDLGKEYKLSIEDMITEKETIILPSAYFTNMQSDKHIVVEFEPVPAKVIVNYLDIDTKENEIPAKVSKTENGNGYVNYDYKTYAKNVPFYELVKQELPENAEGKLTNEDIIVNYWYKKLLFNMKLTKEFSSIKVDGEEVLKEDNKFAKIDIPNTKIVDTNIIVKYKICVTNTEKVSGIATIVEQIPVGFEYVKTTENDINNMENTEKWQEINGKLQLTTRDLRPGETAEYEIELKWNKNMNCIGNLVNIAKITQTDNIPGFEETTLEDNVDSCTIILAIKTGENRDVKTIISISCFILAGICTVIYVITEVIARRKE